MTENSIKKLAVGDEKQSDLRHSGVVLPMATCNNTLWKGIESRKNYE